jgi:hypothetical protein
MSGAPTALSCWGRILDDRVVVDAVGLFAVGEAVAFFADAA